MALRPQQKGMKTAAQNSDVLVGPPIVWGDRRQIPAVQSQQGYSCEEPTTWVPTGPRSPQSRISQLVRSCNQPESERDSPREPKFKWSARRRCQDHVAPKPNKLFRHVLSVPLRFTHHWGSAWRPGGAQITSAAMLVCPFDGALQRDTASTRGFTQLVSATWLVRCDKEKIWIRRRRADVEISILMFIHVYVAEVTQSLQRSLIL